ncbi:unnamed protein product [Rhizoctonia solani]|uniref:Zn(2)-C6 fungal-type domain-containing protein n=1 Tax=Rhizoctonia solani TaxID=456999 RepID=A0A8H3AU46_9AGAM|nr:unnamed protein product [Rhizoctonia solani]CAE6526819.1 unnamed protein product [Rhizoctonia solani]
MMRRRSTTGCSACKRKRRKCDEGKPRCQRCIFSKEVCSYDYLDHPNVAPHLVQRTKPAPRPPSEILMKATRDTSTILELTYTSSPVALGFADQVAATNFTTTPTWRNRIDHCSTLSTSPRCTTDPLVVLSTPFLGTRLSQPNLPHISADSTQPMAMISHNTGAPTSSLGLELGSTQHGDGGSEIIEDHDPEGIQALLCITPNMDKNIKENTLPFVLQSYSQWAIVSVFEPRKIVHAMRDHIIQQFSSEDVRTRTILIANVMNIFAKNPLIDDAGTSIIAYLASKVREDVHSFMAAPPSSVATVDRRNAMRMLDNTLEIMTIQVNTRSLAACIQSVEDAAPVFRRACIEPPGQPLNLANILLDTGLNLRHFVSADILTSVTTGRPTCFKYEVAFSVDLWGRMLQLQENCGLQWLHGLPDQFMLLFAWINSVSEIPGASADPKLITWIETEILQVEIALDQLEDPALRIGREVVREGWRNATLIYLYMVLGRADAGDRRIVRAVKNFMRLVNGIKPERNPDTYLANPMIVVGVAARKERDRHTIRSRILDVPECSKPGTAGYDAVLELENIWTRTKNEGRAAVWEDLRIASFVITGM